MSGLLSWRGWWMVSDELQPGSWDIVRELVWVGHPLMVAAAGEIEQLRHVVDRLNAALDDVTHLTVDRQVLHRIEEARRG